ncbi:MAG: hypothetical protein ACXWCY_07640 [Burkholderiales bacterium]
MGNLNARIVERAELRPSEIEEMYRLYDTYYDATSFSQFSHDLAQKSHVVSLATNEALAGFSTIAVLSFEFEGAVNRALFSGDTIIRHDLWGEQALATAFCRFAGEQKAAHLDVPLYWFLISKGYRTYRYLSAFAHEYYPNPRVPTPSVMRARMEHLARMRFGDAFDAETGVLRFGESKGHLRGQWADVRDALVSHESVSFFLERNPNYRAGEELVCLTELCAANMRSVARRAFVEGLNAGALCGISQ